VAITRLGSDEIQSTAASGSQSVTVPSGTDFIVVGMGGFNNTTNMFSGGTFTIDGNALTSLLPALDDADDTQAIALYYRANPGTGSLTFAWSVSGGAPDEGVIYQFVFYSGVDTADPWRDSGGEATVDEATASTGVLDVEAGDRAVLVGCGNDASGSWGASPSTTITELEENALNAAIVSLADAEPTADTDFTFSPNDSYAACAVGILKPGAPTSPIATLLATGDGTKTDVVDEGDATSNLHESIDDDPRLPDPNDADWNNNTDAGGSAFYDLSPTPGDFDEAESATILVRYRGQAFDGTGTVTLYARIYQSDESTPLSDEVQVAQVTADSSYTNTSPVTLTGIAAGTKTLWDGARLRLRWERT
jgi:hypothetical protein